MGRPAYRKRLSDAEFNAISTLTMHTKLDSSFDVYEKKNGDDVFKDYDEDRFMSLHQGLILLYDSIAYPLKHERMTEEESKIIVNVFRDFGVGTEEGYEWLLSKEVD